MSEDRNGPERPKLSERWRMHELEIAPDGGIALGGVPLGTRRDIVPLLRDRIATLQTAIAMKDVPIEDLQAELDHARIVLRDFRMIDCGTDKAAIVVTPLADGSSAGASEDRQSGQPKPAGRYALEQGADGLVAVELPDGEETSRPDPKKATPEVKLDHAGRRVAANSCGTYSFAVYADERGRSLISVGDVALGTPIALVESIVGHVFMEQCKLLWLARDRGITLPADVTMELEWMEKILEVVQQAPRSHAHGSGETKISFPSW